MILMNITGGLGNQLFEYALYTKLQMLGKDVLLDLFRGERYLHRAEYPSLFDVCALDKDHKSLRLELKCAKMLFRRKKHPDYLPLYEEKKLGDYTEEVFSLDDVYLRGYWFNERYFKDCRNELLKRYQFKLKLNSDNKKMLETIINSENSVSIHVRLGDYVSYESNRKQLGGICTERYYKNAVQFCKEKLTNPTFFVFSNEPEKAAEMFSDEHCIIVNINNQLTGWADMLLMSKCKHQIIANSTFSWWGAWLNENPEKIVIAPNKWVNFPEVSEEIIPSEWIRISG